MVPVTLSAFRLATASRLLATTASLALVLLVGVLLFPTTPDSAHAETPATPTEASPRATTSVSLNVPATIEFADVMATPSGATTTASAKIGVTTTASAGYKLYLYAEDNSLKSLNPNTTQSITSASASSLNNFTNNTWGYNLTEGTTAGTTYSALPTTNTTPTQTKDTSTTNSADDTYTLSLGAKVDSTIPSGTYTSTLTISVVAEPAILAFEGIETMQEMTSTICSNADEGETARLKDARDDKLYWVTKLKDGNCWMTQNLDYDIPADGLTNENGLAAKTDLLDGTVWDSTSGANAPQPTNTTIESVYNSSNYYSTYSYDPGYYVKSDPDAYRSYCTGVSGLNSSSCTSAGWVNVGDGSGYTALTKEQTDAASSGSATYEVTVVDEQAKTYDAHYLVGNYYQWNAATAGTGGESVTSGNTTGSICPKGWTLPSCGTSSTTGNDFYDLTYAYSISSNTAGSTAITQAPLYFSPVGYVGSRSLGDAGRYGEYWFSTAGSSNNACELYFNSGGVYPSNYNSRYIGQSVRCLAR